MKKGFIREQIAFASKVDVSDCPPIQEMLQRLVNNESYQEWAGKAENSPLRPDTLDYPRTPFISLTGLLP